MLPLGLDAIILPLILLGTAPIATPESREELTAPKIATQEVRTRVSQVKYIQSMKLEIEQVWQLYLESEGYTIDSNREKELSELAWYLAQAVERYQRIPVNWQWWNPGRTGITLPKNADAHLVLAIMAGFESKVDPNVVGALGEVGILQCHRWCRKGYSKKELIANTKLSIELAVEFLAKSIDQCGIKLDSFKDKKLQDREWSKPLALYGAGTKALKNGRCIPKKFALARIYKMRELRKLIKD